MANDVENENDANQTYIDQGGSQIGNVQSLEGEKVEFKDLRKAILSRNLREVFRVLSILEKEPKEWAKVERFMRKIGPWGMIALGAFKKRKVLKKTLKVLGLILVVCLIISILVFVLVFAPFIKLATDLSFGSLVTFMEDNTDYVTCASLDAGDVTSCFINKRIEILQR